MAYLNPSLIVSWEPWILQVAKLFLHFLWSEQCFYFSCDWFFSLCFSCLGNSLIPFFSQLWLKLFTFPFAMPLFPANKFLFFLLFPTYFLFLFVKSRSRESFFFLKNIWHGRALLFISLIFSQFFCFLSLEDLFDNGSLWNFLIFFFKTSTLLFIKHRSN